MNERIRELRKMLELNQKDFGIKIGLSQKSIANLEAAGGSVTDRNFDAICRVFHVNSEWLRHGVGEIFVETREALIQSVVDEFGLKPNEEVLLRTFLALPEQYREGVLKWAENFTAMMSAQLGVDKPQREEISERLTVEQKREIVNRQLDEEAASQKKEPASSASTTITGSRKIFGNGS